MLTSLTQRLRPRRASEPPIHATAGPVPPTSLPPLAPALSTRGATVHIVYDPDDPPPRPSPDHIRFVCLSDTHGHTFPVPDGDVLLHTGDLTSRGRLEHFQEAISWLASLPHKKKIVIAGNHDLPLHRGWYENNYQRFMAHREDMQDVDAILDVLRGPEAQAAGIVYLQDEAYDLKVREDGRTWTVFGSPWTPYFGGWAFNYDRITEADRIINAIPKVDILLTHGPPHGILDLAQHVRSSGCHTLLKRVQETIQPRLHVFGHIHEGHGCEIHSWGSNGDGENGWTGPETIFVNAANAPTGCRARTELGKQVPFAGPGFQPVIVDILDRDLN
ncbi:hypothetical protein BOTBODRAFT_114901 [Botryobasidium botryosum FD-172 SS1]|uniref:Calcineurin-like phosphoesterase domain-containing protein n=1 Tax=Botryobasidium botryosum (strain FD-172 SS1) TaxID=930990 RepID=A0A067MHU4_BOTB1|nr:hypothetical protein BOTBODRAFT_114901 [Botryobasidium botryosum FD-172 SS1]